MLRKFSPILAAGLFCFFCLISASHATDQWLEDEVLTQLRELRAEVVANKQEIESLQKELATVSAKVAANAGARPGGEPAPVGVIPLASIPSLGKASATIGIVEFTDFECPFCARHVRETLPVLQKDYIDTGKLRYLSRQFPLDFHAQAEGASAAALCAGEQGKYWEMHAFLFGGRKNLAEDAILASVDSWSLDRDAFKACLTDEATQKRIADDLLLGQQLGVTGTPKFYIGRIKDGQLVDAIPVSGAMPADRFKNIIDSLL